MTCSCFGSMTNSPRGWYLSTKASRQSTLRYTQGSSLSVDGVQAMNLMVTQDTDKVFYPGSAAVWA